MKRPKAAVLLLVLAAALPVAVVANRDRADAQPAPLPTVIGKKVLGYSLGGRAIIAYHLGNPASSIKTVVLGQMHGEEHAGVVAANAIVHGAPIKGIDLWVVPTMNPDGDAVHRRGNNHGVDLNRNWPDKWVPLTGEYYSGPYALSEPETRAMYNFLRLVKPRLMVSLHQPLYGVDTTDGGARDPAFRDRLSKYLGLPKKAFVCWGVCHGSMTGWLTDTQSGSAITVEFGYAPTSTYLTRTVPPAIIRSFGGSYDSAAGHNPFGHLDSRSVVGSTVRFRGWAIDPDNRNGSITVRVLEGSTVRWGAATSIYRPDVNRIYRVSGNHGYSAGFTAPNGTHSYCLQYVNVGPGSADPHWCFKVVVNGSPRGHFDSATETDAGSVRVSGWMFDPDAASSSGQVQVSVDEVVTGTFDANLARPDVDAAFRISGAHGYGVTLTEQPVGSHSYCVTALNLGPAAPNTLLGCRTVTVAG